MLQDVGAAFGLISLGIEGVYLLVDTLVPPLLFAAVFSLPNYFLLQHFVAVIRDKRERDLFWHDLRSNPFTNLRLALLLIAYDLFFGSLLLASLGIGTWWQD